MSLVCQSERPGATCCPCKYLYQAILPPANIQLHLFASWLLPTGAWAYSASAMYLAYPAPAALCQPNGAESRLFAGVTQPDMIWWAADGGTQNALLEIPAILHMEIMTCGRCRQKERRSWRASSKGTPGPPSRMNPPPSVLRLQVCVTSLWNRVTFHCNPSKRDHSRALCQYTVGCLSKLQIRCFVFGNCSRLLCSGPHCAKGCQIAG